MRAGHQLVGDPDETNARTGRPRQQGRRAGEGRGLGDGSGPPRDGDRPAGAGGVEPVGFERDDGAGKRGGEPGAW
jgi:hypothetical protein